MFCITFINLHSSCSGYSGSDIVPDDTLPPITKEGKNTFGCMINDTLWLADKNNLIYEPSFDSGRLNVQGEVLEFNWSSYNFELVSSIGIVSGKSTITSTGKYKIGLYDEKQNQIGGFCYKEKTNYSTNTTYVGELNLLRLDSVKRIVSGTFYFDAIDPYTKRVVKIRDGRFDIKY